MNFFTFKKHPITSLLVKNTLPLVSQYTYKSTTTAFFQYYASIAILGVMRAYREASKRLKGKKSKLIDYSKNTVILHQFPRAHYSPSLSPFAMKLETWCRAANINYANSFGMKTSSKGLIPFIRLNGFQVEDSQKCIEYLSDVFKKDLNAHLTDEQKAIQWVVLKMVEDSLFTCIAFFRFWYSETGRKDTMLPLLAFWNFSYRVYRRTWASGYGRHSKEDLFEIYCKNIKALDVLIGKKKYLLSDIQPSDADFAVFGVCCQVKYNDKSPLNTFMMKFLKYQAKCHNVVRHTKNMQETYWPDWTENIKASKHV